jgi:hypothetical protein
MDPEGRIDKKRGDSWIFTWDVDEIFRGVAQPIEDLGDWTFNSTVKLRRDLSSELWTGGEGTGITINTLDDPPWVRVNVPPANTANAVPKEIYLLDVQMVHLDGTVLTPITLTIGCKADMSD